MQQIYLSDSGPKLSEVIYSFWRWRNTSWGAIYDVSRTIQSCIDLGINAFEFTSVEADSAIEQHLGSLFIGGSLRRDQVVIIGRVGRFRVSSGFSGFNASSDFIFRAVDQLLNSLCTDHLDLLLLEGDDWLTPLEETAFALNRLAEQGKIKTLGLAQASFFRHQQFTELLGRRIVTNQINMSLADTSALTDGRMDFMRQHFVRPLVTARLANGQLVNGIAPRDVLIREELKRIALRTRSHIEQVAIAWLLQLGTIPVIGTMDQERLRHAATASTITLSHDEWYRLYALSTMKM